MNSVMNKTQFAVERYGKKLKAENKRKHLNKKMFRKNGLKKQKNKQVEKELKKISVIKKLIREEIWKI